MTRFRFGLFGPFFTDLNFQWAFDRLSIGHTNKRSVRKLKARLSINPLRQMVSLQIYREHLMILFVPYYLTFIMINVGFLP